jgi:hypothetical protein
VVFFFCLFFSSSSLLWLAMYSYFISKKKKLALDLFFWCSWLWILFMGFILDIGLYIFHKSGYGFSFPIDYHHLLLCSFWLRLPCWSFRCNFLSTPSSPFYMFFNPWLLRFLALIIIVIFSIPHGCDHLIDLLMVIFLLITIVFFVFFIVIIVLLVYWSWFLTFIIITLFLFFMVMIVLLVF